MCIYSVEFDVFWLVPRFSMMPSVPLLPGSMRLCGIYLAFKVGMEASLGLEQVLSVILKGGPIWLLLV